MPWKGRTAEVRLSDTLWVHYISLRTVINGQGQVFEAEDIRFENVPIVTPNGDILLKNLTFDVKPRVMISLSSYILILVIAHNIGTLTYRWPEW